METVQKEKTNHKYVDSFIIGTLDILNKDKTFYDGLVKKYDNIENKVRLAIIEAKIEYANMILKWLNEE